MITLGWPQFIWFALVFGTLAYEIAKHGQVKTGSASKHNALHSLIAFFFGFALLYWGGFFTPCG